MTKNQYYSVNEALICILARDPWTNALDWLRRRGYRGSGAGETLLLHYHPKIVTLDSETPMRDTRPKLVGRLGWANGGRPWRLDVEVGVRIGLDAGSRHRSQDCDYDVTRY